MKVAPAGKGGHKRTRPTPDEIVAATKQHHIDMVIMMMAALCQEHDLLYTSIAHPVAQFLVNSLGEGVRATQMQGDIFYEDLQKLGSDDVAQVRWTPVLGRWGALSGVVGMCLYKAHFISARQINAISPLDNLGTNLCQHVLKVHA